MKRLFSIIMSLLLMLTLSAWEVRTREKQNNIRVRTMRKRP